MVIESISPNCETSHPFHVHETAAESNLIHPLVEPVSKSIEKSHDYFLSIRKSAGYWHFPLEADSTLVGDYVFLVHYLNQVDPVKQKKAVRWILDTQLEDGGWNIYHGGPSELNATVKCAFALQLSGMSLEEEPLRKASEKILELGGLDSVNSYTRFYLGLFGQYPWNKLVAIPPELMFLPVSFYFNIYEISSWSRAILVPMCIVWANKPIKTPPSHVDCSGWWLAGLKQRNGFKGTFSWRTFFITMEAIYRHSSRFIAPFTRRESLRRAEHWMLEHMNRGGGLGAIYPAMMNAVVALDCLGYNPDDPVYQNAVDEFMALMVEEEDRLWFQPCFSPVWDTAITAAALERSGMPQDHPAIVKSSEWLMKQEITIRGDWQIKNPYGPTSGWAFEYENDYYADTDDTAMVLMAIVGSKTSDTKHQHTVMKRGLEWLLSMQSSDGGWGAFDVDNNKEILNNIPFADHNALLDPSCADITGRVLEMLAGFGYDKTFSPAERAVKYLLGQQESDGSWYGRWGVNYIYGTWQAITGLSKIGLPVEDKRIQDGVKWLLSVQNEDGGWGETCVTYDDPKWKGQGPSTASQTAWGLMGILHGGVAIDHPAVERAVRFLVETQQDDGSWNEVEFTGTGFPKVFYLRYTGYCQYFPLMALGLYAEKAAVIPLEKDT